jgi:hypothetical protein
MAASATERTLYKTPAIKEGEIEIRQARNAEGKIKITAVTPKLARHL